MDLVEKFVAQLAIVQTVWLPFLVAVLVVGILVWRAVDYAYSTRLSNADSTKELLERQLQEYRDKLSGATPDEARARMDALEARFEAIEPRKITAEQRQKMAPILDRHKGACVVIASDASSTDAGILSRGLVAVFGASAWQISTPMVMGLGNPPASGIGLGVQDTSSLTVEESAVAEALKAAGLEYDLQTGIGPHPFDGQPAVRIVLSHRLLD
jgi:hypothetical protein